MALLVPIYYQRIRSGYTVSCPQEFFHETVHAWYRYGFFPRLNYRL